MSNEIKCKHDKVYSNECYATLPPKYPWICRKCLTRGIDTGSYVITNEYDILIKKKKKQEAL